jgi:hypothetical protein
MWVRNEPSMISSLPKNDCQTAGFNFNSECLRVLMQTTKGLVIT